jgi:hypothetical protein
LLRSLNEQDNTNEYSLLKLSHLVGGG